MALEPPSQCSEDGRDSEGTTLPFEGINAHGRGSLLVISDGAHVGANARVDEFPRNPNRHQRQPQEEVVIGRWTWCTKEERGAQPEVTARDLVLHGDEETNRLGKGPGSQGQVNGPYAQAERAKTVANAGSQDDAGGNAYEQRHTSILHEQSRGVGAKPGKGMMRQRKLAGIPSEEIPANGQNDVVQASGEHVRVVAGEHPGQPGQTDVCQETPAKASEKGGHKACTTGLGTQEGIADQRAELICEHLALSLVAHLAHLKHIEIVGDLHGLADVLIHQEDGYTLSAGLLQLGIDLLSEQRREPRRWFVHQEQGRIGDLFFDYGGHFRFATAHGSRTPAALLTQPAGSRIGTLT